jgi:hypothetical protein
MKLIRLTTTDENGFFDNAVPDLKIEPKSKIALLNASFDTEIDTIVIDESNNIIDLTINGQANIKTITLDSDTYSNTDYQELFDEISSKLNASLTYTKNSDRGVECNCFVETGNRVSIGYRNSVFETESTEIDNMVKVNLDKSNSTLSNASFRSAISGGTTSNNSFGFIRNNVLARGSGQVSCRTRTLERGSGALEADGFIIGLTETNMSNYTSGVFDPANFKIAVKCEADGNPIKFMVEGGAFTASAIDSNPVSGSGLNERDIVVLRASEGKLEAVINQDNGSGGQVDTIIASTLYNGINDLYPVLLILGDESDCIVDKFGYYLSPYGKSISSYTEYQELGAVNPVKRTGTTLTNNFLEFSGSDGLLNNSLASFLGYNNPRIPVVDTIKSVNFDAIADNTFDALNFSDAYLVELLNLNLQSWDGYLSKKRSLLAVIPESNDRDVNGVVTYESSNLVFLDIDNTNPLLLRNIQARIVRNDNSPVKLKGLSSMTILLKGAND